MRGADGQQSGMFSYVSPEGRIPADQPVRPIREMTDEVLRHLSRRAAGLYAKRRPALHRPREAAPGPAAAGPLLRAERAAAHGAARIQSPLSLVRRPGHGRPGVGRDRVHAGRLTDALDPSGSLRRQAAPAVGEAYGRSWAVPGSETAPGPGRSPLLSIDAVKVGGTQKMLTSTEAWPAPSVMSPAGAPVSVIVLAVPNPNAPALCCWQLGHVPLPSVHCDESVHGLAAWSQEPVPGPVQQLNGLPTETHKLLRGHPAVGGLFGSPSKQSEPAASMSRQKPQNTLCWAVTGPVSV